MPSDSKEIRSIHEQFKQWLIRYIGYIPMPLAVSESRTSISIFLDNLAVFGTYKIFINLPVGAYDRET